MPDNYTSICPTCQTKFNQILERGKARVYCNPKCHKPKQKASKICDLDGCNTRARSNVAPYCEKHYYRLRRNNTLVIDKTRARTITSHGYVAVSLDKDAPLFIATGVVSQYEHRSVFFNTNGYAPHQCNWCKKPIGWKDMHVDHVNEVKTDNAPNNLVASCAICNQQRNPEKNKKASQESSGVFIEHNGLRLCKSQWSRRIGISRNALDYRLKNWTKERALSNE